MVVPVVAMSNSSKPSNTGVNLLWDRGIDYAGFSLPASNSDSSAAASSSAMAGPHSSLWRNPRTPYQMDHDINAIVIGNPVTKPTATKASTPSATSTISRSTERDTMYAPQASE